MEAEAEWADRSWRQLFELAMRIGARLPCVAADLGLSVPQCHVLRFMKPDQPVSMGAVARALGCDASNVTGIVDRLEASGLIERRPSAADRRVRAIALTPLGRENRESLLARIYTPPESLVALSPDELRQLSTLLDAAFGSTSAEAD